MKARGVSLVLIVLVTIFCYILSAANVFALNTDSVTFERDLVQYLSIVDNPSLRLGSEFTVELWVKASPWNYGVSTVFIAKQLGESGWTFYAQGQGQDPNWQTFENHLFTPPIMMDSERWYHFAASQSDGMIRGYLDGIEYLNQPYAGHSESFDELRIGDTAAVSFRNLDGSVDDVRIWNVARSQADIVANMHKELTGNEAGLAAYWTFNGGSLEDLTANNNDLTNHNGATFTSDVPFLDIDPILPTTTTKTTSETIVSSTVLQDASGLALELEAGKTYAVEGELIVAADGNAPDVRIALEAPTGSTLAIGYATDAPQADAGSLSTSGESSGRIRVSKFGEKTIHISGTITAGADGSLQLQWAQWHTSAQSVHLKAGSYLTVEEQ